jgi:hypothetical protein
MYWSKYDLGPGNNLPCASTPLKPMKAAVRCWYTLRETVAQSGPYNLLAVGLGTLLVALLLCRVISWYKLPQMDMLWNS